MMNNDLAKVLITEEELRRREEELGAQIAADYVEKEPILVCILKGASIFYADLCRAIPIPMNMDFMAVSSYGNPNEVFRRSGDTQGSFRPHRRPPCHHR